MVSTMLRPILGDCPLPRISGYSMLTRSSPPWLLSSERCSRGRTVLWVRDTAGFRNTSKDTSSPCARLKIYTWDPRCHL